MSFEKIPLNQEQPPQTPEKVANTWNTLRDEEKRIARIPQRSWFNRAIEDLREKGGVTKACIIDAPGSFVFISGSGQESRRELIYVPKDTELFIVVIPETERRRGTNEAKLRATG